MADVYHSTFNGASTTTHQPKGAAGGAAGWYVANGTGSGNWRSHLDEEVVPTSGVPNSTTLTTPNQWTKCNNSTQGAFFGNNFTVGASASDYSRITRKTDGKGRVVVRPWFYAVVSHNDASPQDIYITWAKNGEVQEAYAMRLTLAQNIKSVVQNTGVFTMDEGDYLEVWAKVAAGNLTVAHLFMGLTGNWY